MANVDTWRLSKIEEELDKLDIPQLDREPYGGNRGLRAMVGYDSIDDQQIYSKAVIHPQADKDKEKEEKAIKKILEKYDSLGKVRPLKEVESLSEESLAVTTSPIVSTVTTGYSTASLGRRRDVGPLQVPSAPRDEYIHIAPEVVSEFPVPAAPMANLKAQDRTLVEADILQVEMFFRSHKTDVFVCTCLVHMYFGSFAGSPTKKQPDNWQYVKSGRLVLIVDNGEARSRGRRIVIVLAEKGTGFQIWKDGVNQLTDYKAASMGFHTMHLSSDHMRRVGFGFDDTVCAADFHRKLLSVTTDPGNSDILSVTGNGKHRSRKRKEDKKHKKWRAPNKSDISSPCCFTHITKLDERDGFNIVGAATAAAAQAHAQGRQMQRDFRTRRLSPVQMTRVSALIDSDHHHRP